MNWAMITLTIGGLLLGFVVPGKPWSAVALGLLAGLLLMVVSVVTTRRTLASEFPSVGWIALDYVVKLSLTGAALLASRYLLDANVFVVAGLVVFAILASSTIQVASFMGSNTEIHDAGQV